VLAGRASVRARWTRSALSALLLCAAWGCQSEGGSGGDGSAVDDWPAGRDAHEERGREVYLAHGCDVCHDGRADAPPDGQDLRTLGGPRSPGWHAMHLFEPELARAGSTMPTTRDLFEPTSWDSYDGGDEDVPRLTADGEALVAYLVRLQDLPTRRTIRHSRLTPLEGVPTGADDLYRIFCANCHGTEGNGDGLAAVFLADESQPRAFRPGLFRVRSALDLPTDDDLLGVITHGMPGSAMPDFSHLPEEARRSLASFVQGFARTVEDGVAIDPFAEEPRVAWATDDSPAVDAALLARGEALLVSLRCGDCHGSDLRGRRAHELGMVWSDEAGRPIPWATDLLHGRFKGGETVEELYLRLSLGMGGSPMPAFADVVPEADDRWALAHALIARRQSSP
jgi:mono/diheme cytochrome c family protein